MSANPALRHFDDFFPLGLFPASSSSSSSVSSSSSSSSLPSVWSFPSLVVPSAPPAPSSFVDPDSLICSNNVDNSPLDIQYLDLGSSSVSSNNQSVESDIDLDQVKFESMSDIVPPSYQGHNSITNYTTWAL